MKLLIASAGILDPRNPVATMAIAGLEATGHTVFPFDPYLAGEVFGWSGAQRLLLLMVKAHAVDWVLCFPPYDLIDPATAAELQALGVPLVGLRYDDGIFLSGGDESSRRRLLLGSSAHCTLAGTTSLAAHRYARAHGDDRLELWPLPISVQTYPVGERPKRYDVTFVGAPMIQGGRPSPRIETVRRLLQAGIRVRVWGHEWEHVPGLPAGVAGPHLDFAGMLQVIHESRLSLTLPGNYHANPQPTVKLRNLEVAACGGVQVQQRGEDIDRLFAPGEEYLPYDDDDELVTVIRQALADDEGLWAMGAAAAKRVRRDYTWARWLERVRPHLPAAGPPRPPSPDAATAVTAMHLALGHACEAAGRFTLAAACFRHALLLAPADASVHAGLARLNERSGEAPELLASRWQMALGTGTGRPYNLAVGPVTGLPGLGGAFPGDPVAEASLRLFQTLCRQGRFLDAAEAATGFAHHQPEPLMVQADAWERQGHRKAASRLRQAIRGE